MEDAEDAKRRSLEAEDKLDREFEMKSAFEAEQLRRNLAVRKEGKTKKLLEKQAAEKAEVLWLDYLNNHHQPSCQPLIAFSTPLNFTTCRSVERGFSCGK